MYKTLHTYNRIWQYHIKVHIGTYTVHFIISGIINADNAHINLPAISTLSQK